MNDNDNAFIPNENDGAPVENLNENKDTAAEQDIKNDYSHYAAPADEDIPKVDAEPVYSPYSNQGNSQQQYTQQQYAQQNYSQQSFSQQPYNNVQQNFNTVTPEQKKKKNKGFKAFIAAVVAIVVCVAVLLAVYPRLSNDKTDTENSTSDGTQLTIDDSPSLSDNSESLSTIKIAENAEKINVGILIYGRGQSFMTNSSNSLMGEGSGILMGEDESGKYTYILTCAHVISDAKNQGYTITVQDSEGNTYDGIMVGFDVKTDIGVLKIAKTGLPVAEFGDSSKLAKGQKVYAIGNPGGTVFFGSFSDGMVSSIDRPISSESGYEMKCIQHTTAINSGNSGGALLNEFGQVIGINSSKIVSTGYEGMAFAIPITDAKPVIDDIIANGRVTNRPKLGITYSSAMNDAQYAVVIRVNHLPAGSLIIHQISSTGSLANTEAQKYDIITKVNGEELDTADVLLEKIDNGSVGDELTLTLCRVNEDYSVKEFTVKVKLVEDTGTDSTQETTTQNYWEQYFNNGF